MFSEAKFAPSIAYDGLLLNLLHFSASENRILITFVSIWIYLHGL